MAGKLVVFNWDDRAERIVRELHAPIAQPNLPIIVLSSREIDPVSYSRDPLFQGVSWLATDVFNTDTLLQVEAHRADTALVLADLAAPDPDGAVALTVLALRRAVSLAREAPEKYGPSAGSDGPHIVAETVNHRKIDLVRSAGAHEVVCSRDYGLGLLAQAVFTPDISLVFDDLLRFTADTNEVYCLRVESGGVAPAGGDAKAGSPEGGDRYELDLAAWREIFEGRDFVEAAVRLLRCEHLDPLNPLVLIGVRRPSRSGTGWHVFLNPQRAGTGDAAPPSAEGAPMRERALHVFDVFRPGDQPIVIAFERPVLHFAGLDAGK